MQNRKLRITSVQAFPGQKTELSKFSNKNCGHLPVYCYEPDPEEKAEGGGCLNDPCPQRVEKILQIFMSIEIDLSELGLNCFVSIFIIKVIQTIVYAKPSSENKIEFIIIG